MQLQLQVLVMKDLQLCLFGITKEFSQFT